MLHSFKKRFSWLGFKALYAPAILLSIIICAPQALYADPREAAEAGLIAKELEKREKRAPERREIPLLVPEEKETPAPAGDQKIFLKAVKFKNNTLLPERKLQRLAAPFVGKEQTLSGLRDLAKTVQTEYRRKGYFLAQVFIPPQQIQDGIVEIEISEGRLGKIIIRGNRHYSESYIRRQFHALEENKILNYNEMIRPMMLLNEHGSLETSAALKKGEAPGTTDLYVDAKEKIPVRNYFSFDNGGSDFVSKERFGSTTEFDNMALPGDRSAVSVAGGSPVENLKFINARYSVPLLYEGTRADFAYSYSQFKAARELRNLNVEGKAQIFHAGLTHALIRNRSTVADAGISFDYKQIQNFTLRTRTSRDEIRMLNFALNMEHADKFHGRTYINQVLSVAFSGIMGATQRNSPAASRSESGGPFVIYQPDIKRVQQLMWDTYFIPRFRGQWSSNPLPSSEEFVIGGIDTVRGFPQGEHLGDTGYILNLEFRLPPPVMKNYEIPYFKQRLKDTFQFATFIDNGSVFRRSISAGETQTSTITGGGFGLRFFFPHDINVSLDWGFPLSGNKPSTGGRSEFYIKVNSRLF